MYTSKQWPSNMSGFLLGCRVGTCWPSRSSFNMCSSVVLPALSRPRKTSFPDFLYKPEKHILQMSNIPLKTSHIMSRNCCDYICFYLGTAKYCWSHCRSSRIRMTSLVLETRWTGSNTFKDRMRKSETSLGCCDRKWCSWIWFMAVNSCFKHI